MTFDLEQCLRIAADLLRIASTALSFFSLKKEICETPRPLELRQARNGKPRQALKGADADAHP